MVKEEFEKLISDVLKANPGLKQEDIATQLGYNDGFISQQLSRNKFSKKFIAALKERFAIGKLPSAGHQPNIETQLILANKEFSQERIKEMEAHKQTLKEHNSFLQKVIESNLTVLVNGQNFMQAQLRTIHQWDALKDAEQHAKDGEELEPLVDQSTEKIERLMADNLNPKLTHEQRIQKIASMISSGGTVRSFPPAGDKTLVRSGPVEQTQAFVGKSRIVVDQKSKKKKDNVSEKGN